MKPLKKLFLSLFALMAFVPFHAIHAAPAQITFYGPVTVRPGQVFQVTIGAKGLASVDTIRLNGTYTPDVISWDNARALGVFRNISPGTQANTQTGAYSFGAYSMNTAFGAGDLVTISFLAQKVGTATITLDNTTRLYSNGVSQSRTLGSYTVRVEGAPMLPITEPAPVIGSLRVFSQTHPDPSQWYASGDVALSWEILHGKTGTVFVNFDQSPVGAAMQPATEGRAQFTVPADGVWYGHVYATYADGMADRIDFPIHVDRLPPTAVQPIVDQSVISQAFPNTLHYAALDETSGIQLYRVTIDGVVVTSTLFVAYPLTDQRVGAHTVLVEAIDRAGNVSAGETTYRVTPEPTSPEVKPPIVSGATRGSYWWDWWFYWLLLIVLMIVVLVYVWKVISCKRRPCKTVVEKIKKPTPKRRLKTRRK